jgi:hypothetical protein
MYLPDELPNARVLITVKTYPFPSSDHGEVECTAGLLNGEKWVRMYPISSSVYDEKRYPKYGWVELDLVKHPSDTRLESYMPRHGLDEPMRFLDRIGTKNEWAARKEIVQKDVFTSMKHLISLTISENRSLGALRPKKTPAYLLKKVKENGIPN